MSEIFASQVLQLLGFEGCITIKSWELQQAKMACYDSDPENFSVQEIVRVHREIFFQCTVSLLFVYSNKLQDYVYIGFKEFGQRFSHGTPAETILEKNCSRYRNNRS